MSSLTFSEINYNDEFYSNLKREENEVKNRLNNLPKEWGITADGLRNKYPEGFITNDGCYHYDITEGKYAGRKCFYQYKPHYGWKLFVENYIENYIDSMGEIYGSVPKEWGITCDELKLKYGEDVETDDGCIHYIITKGKYAGRECYYEYGCEPVGWFLE